MSNLEKTIADKINGEKNKVRILKNTLLSMCNGENSTVCVFTMLECIDQMINQNMGGSRDVRKLIADMILDKKIRPASMIG